MEELCVNTHIIYSVFIYIYTHTHTHIHSDSHIISVNRGTNSSTGLFIKL